jgi:hypothetical protein
MSRYVPVGVGPALALVLVLAAAAGEGVLVLAVALVQACVIAGWHRSVGVPGAVEGALVAGAAALAADMLVLTAPADRPLARMPAVLSLAVLGALVAQLARRDGRPRLVASLTATVCLSAFAALPAAQLAALGSEGGVPLVAATVVPAGLVAAADAVGRTGTGPRWLRPLTAMVAALASGAVVGGLTGLETGVAVATAAASGAVAWAGAVLADRAARPDALLAAALPLALAAPVGYVMGRLLIG